MPHRRSTVTASPNPTSSPGTRTARPAKRASRHAPRAHCINQRPPTLGGLSLSPHPKHNRVRCMQCPLFTSGLFHPSRRLDRRERFQRSLRSNRPLCRSFTLFVRCANDQAEGPANQPPSISMSLLISPKCCTPTALEDHRIDTPIRRHRPVLRLANARPRPARCRLRPETRIRFLDMARPLRPVHQR